MTGYLQYDIYIRLEITFIKIRRVVGVETDLVVGIFPVQLGEDGEGETLVELLAHKGNA